MGTLRRFVLSARLSYVCNVLACDQFCSPSGQSSKGTSMSKSDSVKTMIREAILSHVRWKDRIEAAVQTKGAGIDIEDINNPRHCSFGKWLYSEAIPNEMLRSNQYLVICDLHAVFHHKAAEIVVASRDKNMEEFAKIFQMISDYTSLSDALINAMEFWWQESDV